MKFENKGKWIEESIDDDSTGIFGDEPLDEIEDNEEQLTEAQQLNLFKDVAAEKDAKDISMFAANFLPKICDEINKNYRAIVKNMPATDAQKSVIPVAPVNFNNDFTQLGKFGRVTTKWMNNSVRSSHEISLNKAIQSAEKSKVNKFNGEQFATIALSGKTMTIEVTPKIKAKLQELAKKL